MEVKPTIEPVASAPPSDAPPRPEARSAADGARSPVGRLRGDRHMVGGDARSRERER